MRFVLHLLAALLLIEEDAGCHEDGADDGERLADESRAADSGRGLEQVDGRPYRFAEGLPEASGTAGFFWNGLSFDCFPIACSQTGRLKRRPNRPPTNK